MIEVHLLVILALSSLRKVHFAEIFPTFLMTAYFFALGRRVEIYVIKIRIQEYFRILFDEIKLFHDSITIIPRDLTVVVDTNN
jgi:hypothetical protein